MILRYLFMFDSLVHLNRHLNCTGLVKAIETGIILLIYQLVTVILWKKQRSLILAHLKDFFINSLNLYMFLNFCLMLFNQRPLFKTHKTSSFTSAIDKFIPVSIALGLMISIWVHLDIFIADIFIHCTNIGAT